MSDTETKTEQTDLIVEEAFRQHDAQHGAIASCDARNRSHHSAT